MGGHGTNRAELYWDAARAVRSWQVVGRIRRLLPPRVLAGRPPGATPPWRPAALGLGEREAPQSGASGPPHLTGRFDLVGCSRAFGAPADPDFWRVGEDGLLFAFGLHGFVMLSDYASRARTAEGDRFWRTVIESWLASERRPGLPGWHPFPTSDRLIAWSAALSAIESWPSELRQALAGEIWRQAHYLGRVVERDIGGNHVIHNATALAIVGCVFPSSDMVEHALAILEVEVRRQILPDGGHEERSTSYHRAVRDDLRHAAEAVRRSGRSEPRWLGEARGSLEAWLTEMAGPRGDLPLLNDAWEGPPLELAPSREPVTYLRESGYAVFRDGADQLLCDVGPLCPRHLPPHAHADALSFVLWWAGSPLVVDPGSFAYTGPFRDCFRSTAAHNTVAVDGEDQCVFWGDFRAAKLPRVTASPPRRVSGVWVLTASHDGYRRLGDPVRHDRAFVFIAGRGAVVVDRLHAAESHRVNSGLQLAPGAARSGAQRDGLMIAALGGAEAQMADGWVAPAIGTRIMAPRLRYGLEVEPGEMFGWSLLRDAAVERLRPDGVLVLRIDGRDREVQVFPR